VVADYLKQDEKWKNLVPLRFADYLEADDLLQLVRDQSPRLVDIGCVFHLGACSATTERDAAYLIRNQLRVHQGSCRGGRSRERRALFMRRRRRPMAMARTA
jgi:ADP-L-glycero-D-manno-heptose 6-epimerase